MRRWNIATFSQNAAAHSVIVFSTCRSPRRHTHLVQPNAVTVGDCVPHPTRYAATAFSLNFSPSPGVVGSTNWPFSIAGVSS
jgi:hypothetical protein